MGPSLACCIIIISKGKHVSSLSKLKLVGHVPRRPCSACIVNFLWMAYRLLEQENIISTKLATCIVNFLWMAYRLLWRRGHATTKFYCRTSLKLPGVTVTLEGVWRQSL